MISLVAGHSLGTRATALASVAAALVALATPAGAAPAVPDVKVVDVKAYVYLERAGRLSENMIGAPALVDAPRGGAPGGDTATAVLLDIVFQGDKAAAPAKGVPATVDITQTARSGARLQTHRAFANFAFGPDGLAHKAVFLEGATCMPLEVNVRAGKTTKSARLDFSCEAVPAQK